MVRAGFVSKIFSSWISFVCGLVNELAILVFLSVGLLFQLSGGEESISSGLSMKIQYVAIAAIGLACVTGFVEFVVSLAVAVVKGLKDRKIAAAQKAVLDHRQKQADNRHRVIGNDLHDPDSSVPAIDADVSSSVAEIKPDTSNKQLNYPAKAATPSINRLQKRSQQPPGIKM